MKLEIRSTMTNNLEIGFADSGTSAIAVILPERFQTAGGYAETRPDIETARLFAAAPELLAALVALADEFDAYDNKLTEIGRGHEDYGRKRYNARVAIAKAEGRIA